MLAHNEPQSYPGQLLLGAPTKRSTPTQYMFIDSSNGGVNAKPDKVVRSFVMKSARNKKPWSTRPKSPKTGDCSETKVRRRSYGRKRGIADPELGHNNLPQLDCSELSPSVDHLSTTSPSSVKSDSIFSCHNIGCACDSPASSYTSPLIEFKDREDAFNLSLPHYEQSPCHGVFNIAALGSLNCLVVTLDIHSEGLLQHFIEAAAPRLIPIDPHRSSQRAGMEWIRTCIQSQMGAPFIYAVLSCSARAAQLDPEAYKWRAMSEVNGLLSDPRTSTNDTTIAAVLILLAKEEAELADTKRRGDEHKCRLTRAANEAHHNGLKTMIQQRGGLAALGGNRFLQVCLLMHSIAQSITTFKQPYAILLDASGQIEDYAVTTNQSPNAFGYVLRPFRELNIDCSLLKIIFAITVFVADLKDWYEGGICSMDSLDMQKHASLLTYRLFQWCRQSEHGAIRGPAITNFVDQSVCLALLIFMVNATEPNATSFGPRLSKVVIKLRQSLRQTQMLQWAKAPDLLFWVLIMGALGAKSLPKTQKASGSDALLFFFKEHIRLAFAGDFLHHQPSAEHVLDRMGSCLWVPSVFNEPVKLLWVSMGFCGASVTELEDTSGSEGEQVDDEYALGQSTTLRFFTADKYGDRGSVRSRQQQSAGFS